MTKSLFYKITIPKNTSKTIFCTGTTGRYCTQRFVYLITSHLENGCDQNTIYLICMNLSHFQLKKSFFEYVLVSD